MNDWIADLEATHLTTEQRQLMDRAVRLLRAGADLIAQGPPMYRDYGGDDYWHCAYCNGRESEPCGHLSDDFDHNEDCPWAALVAAYEEEQKAKQRWRAHKSQVEEEQNG